MISADEFKALILYLFVAFNKEPSDLQVQVYWDQLKGYSSEQLQRAVRDHVASGKFVATVAELRQAIDGSPDDKAVRAWGIVSEAMDRHGDYRHVDFGQADPYINATIRNLGGWPAAFAQCGNAEETKWYRHNFISTYKSMAAGGVDGEVCTPLAGLSESGPPVYDPGGKLLGFSPPIPIVIGSDKKPPAALTYTPGPDDPPQPAGLIGTSNEQRCP